MHGTRARISSGCCTALNVVTEMAVQPSQCHRQVTLEVNACTQEGNACCHCHINFPTCDESKSWDGFNSFFLPSSVTHQTWDSCCMARCIGKWGCAAPSTADDSSCSGTIQRAAQQAPAGLPIALNFYRMEHLLQISADSLSCILLAMCCTRNFFTSTTFSTHSLLTCAPGAQSQ